MTARRGAGHSRIGLPPILTCAYTREHIGGRNGADWCKAVQEPRAKRSAVQDLPVPSARGCGGGLGPVNSRVVGSSATAGAKLSSLGANDLGHRASSSGGPFSCASTLRRRSRWQRPEAEWRRAMFGPGLVGRADP